MSTNFLQRFRRVVAGLLVLALTLGMMPAVSSYAYGTAEMSANWAEEVYNLDTNRRQALEEVVALRNIQGIIGFEGDYELPADDSPVYVIVLFGHNPASIQVLEAQIEGYHLPISAAEAIVENEHETFRRELAALFSDAPFARLGTPYEINIEFRDALNGVSMRLPANMLEEVSAISVVRAIYPDVAIDPPEIPEEMATDEWVVLGNASALIEAFNADSWGMQTGRSAMNADYVHDMGYTGEGILIGIIDSGIDWMHPAFYGSFPTAAWMAGRGNRSVTISQEELLNVNVDQVTGVYDGPTNYVFVGRDLIRLWPGGQGQDIRANPTQGNPGGDAGPGVFDFPQTLPTGMPGNNPMEVSPIYFPTRTGLYSFANPPSVPGFSTHGTHVSGTILGRSALDVTWSGVTNPVQAILGVAPGAMGVHYRGLYGSTPTSVILAAMEWAVHDRVDVVNMSLGGGLGAALPLQTIAVNNIMLADPDIVFVISAGNNGPALYTLGNPSAASMSISVSALVEPLPISGLLLQSDYGAVADGHMYLLDRLWIDQLDDTTVPGRTIFAGTDPDQIPSHDNGIYRIFALPDVPNGTGRPGPAGTPPGLIDVPLGFGTVEDFEELYAIHGADLEGHFVLVRRGMAFVDVVALAYERGLRGVISVSGAGQAPMQVGTNIPIILMRHDEGVAFANAIVQGPPEDHYGTFYFTDTVASTQGRHVVDFSSSGPVVQSFEIKPEIGAQGSAVFSSVPRWGIGPVAGWATRPWNAANANSQGTSMSAPHVAGAVALMQQYSQANTGGRWSNDEIRTRIMNTAIPVDYTLASRGTVYGVFDGARQINVLAAIEADTVVMVTFPYVATVPFLPLESQPPQSMQTGSFSFGGFNRAGSAANAGMRTGTLTATIFNNSNVARTYTLTSDFINNARFSRTGGVLTLSSNTVTVPANGSANFDATLTIPATADTGAAAHGFYQGYVTVSTGGMTVARLPFAGVSHYRPTLISNVTTYRPVVTTSEYAQNYTSNELVVSFNADWGFFTNLYLLRYDSDMNESNWRNFEILGNTMLDAPLNTARFFPAHRGLDPDTPIRGVIFDGTYIPLGALTLGAAGELTTLEEEGKFVIVMNVYRQTPNAFGASPTVAHPQAGSWAWEQTILVPFYVDNTPPEITSLTINDTPVDLTLPELVVSIADTNDIVVEGNVFDAWTVQMADTDLSFDVWLENMPVSIPDNLALWVLAGENDSDNRPIRAELEPNGDFTVVLENAMVSDTVELSLRLIDGYAPVPVVNQVPIGVFEEGIASVWNTPALANIIDNYTEHFEMPYGFVLADTYTTEFLRSDRIFGHAADNNPEVYNLPDDYFNRFVWSGLNIVNFNVLVTSDETFIPVTDIVGIPEIWEIDVPLPIDELATVLPLDASNREIVWTVISGPATVADGVLIATDVGTVELRAVITNGALDPTDNTTMDFTKVFFISIVEELYFTVTFSGEGGLVIPAEISAEEAGISNDNDSWYFYLPDYDYELEYPGELYPDEEEVDNDNYYQDNDNDNDNYEDGIYDDNYEDDVVNDNDTVNDDVTDNDASDNDTVNDDASDNDVSANDTSDNDTLNEVDPDNDEADANDGSLNDVYDGGSYEDDTTNDDISGDISNDTTPDDDTSSNDDVVDAPANDTDVPDEGDSYTSYAFIRNTGIRFAWVNPSFDSFNFAPTYETIVAFAVPIYEIQVRAGQSLGDFLPSAEHDVYDFLGWVDGDAQTFDADTLVLADMNVYALWTEPRVISVTVSPPTSNVPQGGDLQFTAEVEAEFGASEDVSWEVSNHNGVSINNSGLLTVGSNVPVGTVITVRAVSDFDNTVYGTATATVIASGEVEIPQPPAAPQPPVAPPAAPSIPSAPAQPATPSPRTTSRVQRQTTSRPAGSTHGTAQQQQQQDTTPRIIGQQATVTISYDGVANLVIATENITAGTYAISILGLPVGIVVPAYADVLNNQLLLVLPGITVDMMGIHYLTITIYNANGEIIATRDGFAFTITDIIPAQELVPVPTQPITPISEGSVSLRFVINSSQYTANGVQMSIADNAAPFIDPIYERTMMPLRAVAESLGATVTWVEETRTVIIVRAGQTITLSIDEALPAGMGMPAIVNGRTFVPLRYVAELLGADVRWDNDARAVYVLM